MRGQDSKLSQGEREGQANETAKLKIFDFNEETRAEGLELLL